MPLDVNKRYQLFTKGEFSDFGVKMSLSLSNIVTYMCIFTYTVQTFWSFRYKMLKKSYKQMHTEVKYVLNQHEKVEENQ